MPSTRRVGVELLHEVLHIILGRRIGEMAVERQHPGGDRRLVLVAHVHLRCRVGADEDGRQPNRSSALGQCSDPLGDLGRARPWRRPSLTELVRSMSEMPPASEDQRHAAFVSGCDDLIVSHRATRLDQRNDAGVGQHVEAVAKRKEGVAGGDRAGGPLPGPERARSAAPTLL